MDQFGLSGTTCPQQLSITVCISWRRRSNITNFSRILTHLWSYALFCVVIIFSVHFTSWMLEFSKHEWQWLGTGRHKADNSSKVFFFVWKMKPWLKIDIRHTWEMSKSMLKLQRLGGGFCACAECVEVCVHGRIGRSFAFAKAISHLLAPFLMLTGSLSNDIKAAWWHCTHALCAVCGFQPPVCMSLCTDKSVALSAAQPVTWLSELKCLHLCLISAETRPKVDQTGNRLTCM